MNISITNKNELVEAIQTLPVTPMVAILFGGERLMVTNWGAVATDGDAIIGLATVAERGEMASGIPTLVGVMVLPEWRRRGIGLALLWTVVEEAGRRGLLPLLYEALTPSGLALAKASGYGPEVLALRDQSFWGIELP
jgi:GNAT superfamily N-acetyltransferase